MSSVYPINSSMLQSTVYYRTSSGQWNMNDEDSTEGKRFHVGSQTSVQGYIVLWKGIKKIYSYVCAYTHSKIVTF